MLPGRVIVLDVGKTLAKLSLWSEEGRLIERFQRYNARVESRGRHALDTEGIEQWALEILRQFARRGPVSAIVPVAHGAAAAVLRAGRLACPVADYEDPVPQDVRAAYDAQRDAFALTGSPALPDGLNLGAQLYRLEQERPELLTGDASIVTWPQYWAWKLSAVTSSEVSSLGCHTDLWRPGERGPSAIARERGWFARLAPRRRADERLGSLSEEWAARTGLSAEVGVYCGVHDSNAALLAAHGFTDTAAAEVTVISTGTWFVAMRVPQAATADWAALPESRDCLVNVDVEGRPIPSARFMGGRELERIGGLGVEDAQAALQALPEVLETGAMALPGWVPGVGPYGQSRARWLHEPRNPAARAAAAGLYAALMMDTSLELIGSSGRLIVEGRFAGTDLFVRALAALRPDAQVLVNGDEESAVPYGALRLLDPTVRPPGALRRIAPLEADLTPYKARWREAAEHRECAA